MYARTCSRREAVTSRSCARDEVLLCIRCRLVVHCTWRGSFGAPGQSLEVHLSCRKVGASDFRPYLLGEVCFLWACPSPLRAWQALPYPVFVVFYMMAKDEGFSCV